MIEKVYPKNKRYSVRSDGTILNYAGIPLHPDMSSGKPRVTLSEKGRRHRLLVSRVVAETYFEDVDEDDWICHIDRNPCNNSVYNLSIKKR